ncbi:hypothetical protein F5Y04DRAFT_245781 [Hypomontagnella monticulosa]|nr:hypothetical protein F5Y04DRAFT_245781 [Hypomontagnella monticulosa]
MTSSYRQLCRLLTSWYILALASPSWFAAQAIDFPTSVEVNLIFPRNDTYAPTQFMPIVFSIQNSKLAAALDLNVVYYLFQHDTEDNPQFTGFKNLNNVDFSNASDPYFVLGSTDILNTAEATWSLVWTLASGNCSYSTLDMMRGDDTNLASNFTFRSESQSIIFTTKNGAQKPDLTSKDDGTCGNTTGTYRTFNVTGIMDVPSSEKYDGHNTCAVLGSDTTPTPTTGSHCGPRIDPSAAESLAAAVTCDALHPVSGCPTETPSTATTIGGPWLMMAAICSIVYYLVL